MSFSDYLRQTFKSVLNFFSNLFLKAGISPNALTLIGLFGNILSGVLIGFGKIQLGGLVALVMGPLDAVDGCMARILGYSSPFGAFLDSITDRYSELSILAGLFIYFLNAGNLSACILVFAATTGSVLVSYVRARGESLGYNVKTGVLTRVERYLVMAPALVLNVPIVALWVIAVMGNFTALQRIWQVWSQSKQIQSNKN
jgi:CDP-diacylglycerol--glycerol-3-phosphate 3-phosphatidyltransferase